MLLLDNHLKGDQGPLRTQMGLEGWLTSLGGSIGCIHGGGQIVRARSIHVEDVPPLLLRGHHLHGCFGAQHGAQQIGLHHLSDLLRACIQEALQEDNRLSVFILHLSNDFTAWQFDALDTAQQKLVERCLCRSLSTALREMCRMLFPIQRQKKSTSALCRATCRRLAARHSRKGWSCSQRRHGTCLSFRGGGSAL